MVHCFLICTHASFGLIYKTTALIKNGGESRRRERSGKGQGSLITPPHSKVLTILVTHSHSLNEQTQSVCRVKIYKLSEIKNVEISKTGVTINASTRQRHSEQTTVCKSRTAVIKINKCHALILWNSVNQMMLGEEQWSLFTRKTQPSECIWVEVVSVVRLHVDDKIILWRLARR